MGGGLGSISGENGFQHPETITAVIMADIISVLIRVFMDIITIFSLLIRECTSDSYGFNTTIGKLFLIGFSSRILKSVDAGISCRHFQSGGLID